MGRKSLNFNVDSGDSGNETSSNEVPVVLYLGDPADVHQTSNRDPSRDEALTYHKDRVRNNVCLTG